jgi:hypothetical protein
MTLKDLKIRLKQVSNELSLNSAQYALTYRSSGSEETARESSYQILSTLKDDHDLIIEINSAYFNLSNKKKEEYFHDFVNGIRTLDLVYKYRKVSVNSSSSFAFLFGNKTTQAHEIMIYVPNKVWLTEEFRSLSPIYNARYYITENNTQADEILEKMYQMMDTEKLEFFPLIIFDGGILSNMGINSKTYTLEDLEKKLGIR